ncbi:MAG: sigma-54-dependent Fis family transcriptional regulator [Deltaproteobacteria bacterium]|nr:sigma-54-dependent Fis family transcriptional regulator [Deltaproteobacteria bacterium]
MTLWCSGQLSFVTAVQCLTTTQLLPSLTSLTPGDTVLVDLDHPGELEVDQVIDGARRLECRVIAACHPENVQRVVQAVQRGAEHVILKPVRAGDLAPYTKVAAPARVADVHSWRAMYAKEIVGESRALVQALTMGMHASEVDCPILVTGESGTGKELFARALHRGSPRRAAPCIPVNCPAIPKELVESELFGHAKGAFTGAATARVGRFAAADSGTLFLDEIGEMDLNIQSKLLRVLQDYEITPVGESRSQKVNVRIIAATNRDLEAMSDQGTFREDLFYRLNVVQIHLPSLQERRDDIPGLVRYFLETVSEQRALPAPTLTPSVEDALLRFRWPGNVRQLRNVIERLVILHRGQRVELEHLPPSITREQAQPAQESTGPEPMLPAEGFDLRSALQRFEESMISKALSQTGGNRNQAAKILGLNRTTLVEKLRKLPQFVTGQD